MDAAEVTLVDIPADMLANIISYLPASSLKEVKNLASLQHSNIFQRSDLIRSDRAARYLVEKYLDWQFLPTEHSNWKLLAGKIGQAINEAPYDKEPSINKIFYRYAHHLVALRYILSKAIVEEGIDRVLDEVATLPLYDMLVSALIVRKYYRAYIHALSVNSSSYGKAVDTLSKEEVVANIPKIVKAANYGCLDYIKARYGVESLKELNVDYAELLKTWNMATFEYLLNDLATVDEGEVRAILPPLTPERIAVVERARPELL